MDRERRTTFHCASALLPDGWADDVRIELADGVISAVSAGEAAHSSDHKLAAILPGLPNLHSHAFQRGMAGLAEVGGITDDGFWTWRETMYRFVDRLTPDHLLAIAALAYVEMLESGFTRVGEFHYLHHDRDGRPFADPAAMSAAIVAAAVESGIALTLLPVFYAHGGFGGMPATRGQRRFVNDIDGFASLVGRLRRLLAQHPDAVLGLSPHSLRASTPDELRAIIPLVDGPIHIHIAEQAREVADCLAWSGARPVDWLLANAPVDRRWCLVHATHMTPDEARRMAMTGAVAGLCPITEANLGDGIFTAGPFLEAGGQYGVGSDSNVLIDATEELRWLEYGQRLDRRGRNLLAPAGAATGTAIYRAALEGGARALGAPCGIAPGAAADFLSLDLDHASLIGRSHDALLDGLIFAAGRGGIDGVWRRGRQVVERGRHIDRERIAVRYGTTLRDILQ